MTVSRTMLAAAAVLLGLAPYGQSQNVPENKDGYHLSEWLRTEHLANYTEWWYFNVYDSSNNVQAIFSYLVNNPDNQPGGLFILGISEMAAVAYTNRGIVSESDLYFANAFSAMDNKANVRIGNNAVNVIDPDTYQIKGASRNGRILWDLTYQRTAPPWYAAKNFNVAAEPWQLMSWLLYMPAASVTGTLTVDGTAYQVRGPGYHDHNWGEWELTRVPWNWAQYSQPGLTFDLGDFPNKPGGVASIEVNGKRQIFQNGEYLLIHTAWAYDWTHFVYYPTQSIFLANNGTAQIILTMTVQRTAPLSAPLPPWIPNAIIYEQTAAYDGQVSIDGNSKSFAGNGFKEYTALTQ
jgi:hypothetical protein